MTRRPVLHNLDHDPPLLTTRRLDAFTSQEFTVLELAEEQASIWIARGPGAHIALEAAHALQRLGYLWPVSGADAATWGARMADAHGWGFRITDDGRRALGIARARGGGVTIAALYVASGGVYFGLPDVDPWDETRDARVYAGPHRVIAHPPCERWGRYWGGAPSTWPRLTLGDDDGCFSAALAAVRKYGGVLEHPEGSHAWRAFDLNIPPHDGGWIAADWFGGWTCCVEQGWYGHRARKKTWLYVHGIGLPPSLKWGKSPATERMDEGFHSTEERRRAIKTDICQRLSAKQRAATPIPFRDLLIDIAESAVTARAAA